MLRSLAQKQASRSTGYVCSTCKHKLNRSQRRWQNNLATSTQGGGDDWLSNFNDISADNARPINSVVVTHTKEKSNASEVETTASQKVKINGRRPSARTRSHEQRQSIHRAIAGNTPLASNLNVGSVAPAQTKSTQSSTQRIVQPILVARLIAGSRTKKRTASYWRRQAARNKGLAAKTKGENARQLLRRARRDEGYAQILSGPSASRETRVPRVDIAEADPQLLPPRTFSRFAKTVQLSDAEIAQFIKEHNLPPLDVRQLVALQRRKGRGVSYWSRRASNWRHLAAKYSGTRAERCLHLATYCEIRAQKLSEAIEEMKAGASITKVFHEARSGSNAGLASHRADTINDQTRRLGQPKPSLASKSAQLTTFDAIVADLKAKFKRRVENLAAGFSKENKDSVDASPNAEINVTLDNDHQETGADRAASSGMVQSASTSSARDSVFQSSYKVDAQDNYDTTPLEQAKIPSPSSLQRPMSTLTEPHTEPSQRVGMPNFLSNFVPAASAPSTRIFDPASKRSPDLGLDPEPEPPQRVAMPDFSSANSPRVSTPPSLPIPKIVKPKSLARKVKEAKSRPGWGTTAVPLSGVVSPTLERQEQESHLKQIITQYSSQSRSTRQDSDVEQHSGASSRLAHLHRAQTIDIGATVPAKTPRRRTRQTPSKGLEDSPATENTTTIRKRETPKRKKNEMVSVKTSTSEAPSSEPDGSRQPSSSSSDHGGDHKPLWEVMSTAQDDAVSSKEDTAATSGPEQSTPQISEHSETTDIAKDVGVDSAPLDLSSSEDAEVASLQPSDLQITPLNIPQPRVPGLEYGLDRVLFNSGVYQLQDPYSRVYNFDPYLQKIMPVDEFDFNALKEYKTSSQDTALSALAKEHNKRYIGSTSSMTSTLGHFHYLLSNWRPINLAMVSRGFTDKLESFTLINRAPTAIFLRRKNGTYAIDADKEFDSANVLMMLGKSMEKLLTLPTSEYERYRKSDPRSISEEERNEPEAFEYTTMGDFLMRSQLDAYDSRLPGNGMFDLKTRAVVSVRMDSQDFQPMTGYEIHTLQGRFESYEREYYDMIRSTMLKYILQARMGRMDGIFVAYHNVERIFGFQYIRIQEIDRAIHGQVNSCLGDQEFKASLELLNKVFDKATAKFPEQSLRFHFETTAEPLTSADLTTVMWIYAEPMEEKEIDRIQSTSKAKIAEFEQKMMGMDKRPEHDSTATAEHGGAPSPAVISTKTENSASGEPKAANTGINSSADVSFLKEISASESTAKAPLFVASLICKSRVNGSSVDRPDRLKPTDTWEIEYLLQEWDPTDAMWACYEQTKAKRRELFEKFGSEDAPEGENGEWSARQKRDRSYIEFLRSMSQRGREFREKMDKLDEGREQVIVGMPVPPKKEGSEESVQES